MEVVFRVLRQGNVRMVTIKETKLTNRIHMRYGACYSVWVTEVEIRHRGEGCGSVSIGGGLAGQGDI